MSPMVGDVARFRIFLGVGFLALAVRLAYFREHLESAFFGVPILDEKFYDTAARLLASGGDLATLDPGFRPLLYPLFLSFWYRLAGDWGDVAAIVAQHLLGTSIAVLVAVLAMRLFRRNVAGLVAGSLYALAGPPLFFEGELLITTLYTFLCLVAVLALGWAERGEGWVRWFLAGLVLGLGVLARANLLLYFLALPVAWFLYRREPRWQRGVAIACAGLGALVPLALSAAWQAPHIGRYQLVPSAGGINFYLGNKAGADGMVPRQDWAVTYGAEYRDSVAVFAREAYLRDSGDPAASPQAVSRYWLERTAREILSGPGRWLGLMMRKALFVVWTYEIPNNKSFTFITEYESKILAWLPVRWWWLWCLAPLGVAWAWRSGDRRQLFWLLAFLATGAVGIVLFFVNARFRIPLWPGMAALAGGGLVTLVDLALARAWRSFVPGISVAGGLAALSLVSWTGVDPETPGRDFFFRSLAHLEKGQAAAAVADARSSVEHMPDDPAAVFQLGNAAMAMDSWTLARQSYLRAADLAPAEPRIVNNLAILDEREGRFGDAYRGYLQALALADNYAPALVNAALLELRADLPDRAAPRVMAAEAQGFVSLPMFGAQALLAAARGDEATFHERLDQARRIDSAAVDRFLELHRQHLEPADLGLGLDDPLEPGGSGRL